MFRQRRDVLQHVRSEDTEIRGEENGLDHKAVLPMLLLTGDAPSKAGPESIHHADLPKLATRDGWVQIQESSPKHSSSLGGDNEVVMIYFYTRISETQTRLFAPQCPSQDGPAKPRLRYRGERGQSH